MNIEKLVELLRVEHPCEECPHNEVHMSSCLGEDGCVYIRAAMVIEQLHLDNITLRAENAELKTNHQLSVNAGADAVRQLNAVVERLTKTSNGYAASARIIALYLADYCDGTLPYPEMIAEASRKASAEISRLQSDNDRMAGELEAAVGLLSGHCLSCAFVNDCSIHDHNDISPTTWYYGDCEDWKYREPKAKGE